MKPEKISASTLGFEHVTGATLYQLYSFKNLNLSFILRILLKFHKFKSRHSYETYSYNKESASYARELSSDYMTSANDINYFKLFY